MRSLLLRARNPESTNSTNRAVGSSEALHPIGAKATGKAHPVRLDHPRVVSTYVREQAITAATEEHLA